MKSSGGNATSADFRYREDAALARRFNDVVIGIHLTRRYWVLKKLYRSIIMLYFPDDITKAAVGIQYQYYTAR